MTARHASLDDIHGYIELSRLLVRFSLFCGCLVMVAAIALLLLRIGSAS